MLLERRMRGNSHVRCEVGENPEITSKDYLSLIYILHMWDYNTPVEETMEILHEMIQAGKVKYIGISNCYAWQIAKANEIAKANGWETFISVQNHYNLIFREEEREMASYCQEENIAMTPYSSLASGRLAKHPGEQSKRLSEDKYAKGKYDASYNDDLRIIERVEEIADKKNISMTEISLAWLMTKVTAPVVGATKKHHIDAAVKAADIILSDEEIKYLEELYKPHPLVGVMSSNK